MSIQELESRMSGLERWQQYLNDKLMMLERKLGALEHQSRRRDSNEAENEATATPEGEWRQVTNWPRG
jgi:hypothetical protein